MLSREAAPFRPWALIPAKRFGRAKTRLASVLEAVERRALARALCERVLCATRGAAQLEGVLIATDGDDAARLGARYGAYALRDREPSSLAQVVDAGLSWLKAQGATHALVLMADLPAIEARDVRELLAAAREHAVVITPDAARRGTNALALALDLEFSSAFGSRDSLTRHVQGAARAGVKARVVVQPRVGFDLDSPAELARYFNLPLPLPE